MKRLLQSSPLAGFSSLVILVVIGIAADLFSSDWSNRTKWLIFAGTVLLAVYVYFLEHYRPRLVADEVFRRQFIELILSDVFERYRDLNPGVTDVRVNVMLPHRQKLWKRLLTIRYTWGSYTAQELRLAFSPGIGCSGTAYHEGNQVYFDRQRNHVTLKGMTDDQLEATANVQSILSTPIFRDRSGEFDVGIGTPIGVLNLDSPLPVDITNFDQENVQQMVAEYSSLVSALI